MDSIDSLRTELLGAVAGAADGAALEAVRVDALGKKGAITGLMKDLGALAPEERKAFGQRVNALRDDITAAIEAKKVSLSAAALDARLAAETFDVTLPVRPET